LTDDAVATNEDYLNPKPKGGLGADIHGVDLSETLAGLLSAIEKAWYEQLVLRF
jgi:hypothetical protein